MCGTHPLYGGNTISVNADSCRVNVGSEISVQVTVFACDAPEDKAALVAQKSSVPVIFNVFESLEDPVIQSFIGAVAAPIPEAAQLAGSTNFEELCAGKSLNLNNEFYAESRLGKIVKTQRDEQA